MSEFKTFQDLLDSMAPRLDKIKDGLPQAMEVLESIKHDIEAYETDDPRKEQILLFIREAQLLGALFVNMPREENKS